MDHVKLKIEEGKTESVHTFGFAYTTKDQEVKWVDTAIVATKHKGGDWTFDTSKVKDITLTEFATYKTLVEKVQQVIDTNATNLSGVKIVHPEK